MDESKALIAVTGYSYYTKSYETIFNRFSWPPSGEEAGRFESNQQPS